MRRKGWTQYAPVGYTSHPTMTLGHFLRLCFLSWALSSVPNQATGEGNVDGDIKEEVLLDDSEAPRQLPLNLGHRPHECVGNVNQCPRGFTLTLNFIPAPPKYGLPAEYIISSGGQSMLSEGIYFRRNYGMQYEVGVAKSNKEWTVTFDLDWRSSVPINIAIAWTNALDVYVDGFLLVSDAEGRSRLYTEPLFDPFIDMVVGGPSDVPPAESHTGVVYGLKHWDKFHDRREMESLIPASLFKRGCAPPPTLPGAEDVTLEEGVDPANSCRRLCKQEGKRLALLSPTSSECTCYTPVDLNMYLGLAKSQQPCWSAYVTSGAARDSHPIGLSYTQVLPTDKGYTRPDESITYYLDVDTLAEVIFYLDFGDGTQLKTTDHLVGHHWKEEGTYMVNITAVSRLTQETKLFDVKIELVDEGIAPEKVLVEASYTSESRKISINTHSISSAMMECVLNFGDGNSETINGLDGLIDSRAITHTYEVVGIYEALISCTNSFGTTTNTTLIPVRNISMNYETNILGVDIMIPCNAASTHANMLKVLVDGLAVQPVMSERDITIPREVFSHSGEHLIEVKTDNGLLRRTIANIQDKIKSLTIRATPEHTTKDSEVFFVFSIEAGDHIHVHVDYGDDTQETLYFAKSRTTPSITIYRTHVYRQYGKFNVLLRAANDVSFKSEMKLISIERPILFASVSVNNVTFLGQSAEFAFTIDEGTYPALPVHVELDLGNGETTGGVIGEMRYDDSAAIFNYEYKQYGIYDVLVKVSNNLSELVLMTRLQVGENITQVDLKTNKQVANVDEEIEISIDCPHGQPVLYDISLGDGQIIRISVPHDYVPEHDMVPDQVDSTTPYTYYSTDGMSVSIAANRSNVDVSKRSKRQAERDSRGRPTMDGSALAEFPESTTLNNVNNIPTIMTTEKPLKQDMPTRAPNEVIVARYTYKVPGQYTVKVKTSNLFGSQKSWSCPPIRIVPSLSSLTCEKMTASLSIPSTEDSPHVALRSEEVRVQVGMETSCTNLDGDPVYDYTWHSEKKAQDSNIWRPELGVCHSGFKEPTLVIPARTLWYGHYHLKVTIRLRVDPKNLRERRALPEDVTVTLEPTTDQSWLVHKNIAETKLRLEETLRQLRQQVAMHKDVIPEPQDQIPLDLNDQQLTIETTSTDLYLDIQPSPLVAKFKDESHLDIPRFETISLKFEGSHDPDVDIAQNRTGMKGHIFCYPDSIKPQWTSKTLDEKLSQAAQIGRNTFETAFIYDTGCFQSIDRVWILGWESVFPAENLYKNDTMNFELFVTKDTRVATTTKTVRVLFSNATGVDMLDNIDALLASGDTNAALLVIDLVSGMLDSPAGGSGENDTEAKAARSQVRGKLVGALEKVSGNIQNFDQVEKTTGTLSSVTQVKDEVTDESKETAAEALANTGDAIEGVSEGTTTDQMTGVGGSILTTAGDIMPFGNETDEGELDIAPCGKTAVEPHITVTTTTSSFVPGQGDITTTTTTVSTPTSRTVTTSSPSGVQVTTTPVTPIFRSSPTPAVMGNISVTVEGIGEMTLSTEGWTTTTPMPTTTTSTTTTTAIPTTTPTLSCREPTTPIPTNFVTTPAPGTEEPTPEPVIPCCLRVPEGGLCEWVEPVCEFLAEEDRKKTVWSDHVCDEIHPDDMEEIVLRFRMYKAQQKRMLYNRRKKTTTGALKAVDSVGNVLLKKTDDKTNISIATPDMKVSLDKVDPSANGSTNGISFPGSALKGQTGNVGAKSMESPNPFTYSDSASSVKSKVKSLSFVDEDGNDISVQDSEPIDIWIKGKADYPEFKRSSGVSKQELQPGFGRHVLIPGTINPHEVNVTSNDSSIHAIIIPDNPDDELEVFIKYMDFPNHTFYDAKSFIPNNEAANWDFNDELSHLKYTFFPPQQVTPLNGTYRIGVNLAAGRVNYKESTQQNSSYQILIVTSGCRFWDLENDTWSSRGCWVGNYTTIRHTQCQCTHLTSFGGDFVVPPNTINFATVFSLENFIEAIPVFVTVGLVLLLYIGALIWARREDKKDLIKWGAGPLEDNLPSDNYHYQLTINTGVKKNSGTKSKVSFILSGDTGDTGCRRLYDGKRKELPTSSIYNYVLSVEQCLGPLTYLRIWHDNSGTGKHRSWFLGQVQVVDLQTGEKFFFLCDRWLAVEQDDGMVERIVPVAGMGDLTAFKHLFGSSVRKKLTNDHLWVSIMQRPTRSTFTRVQRLSCCVSLLFLTMITNCMFFKADEKVENVSVVKVGPLTFTLHQLFISVVTTAIVFPPNMFIVVVFRKARAKKNTIQHLNQQASKKFKWRTLSGGSALWGNAQRTRAQKFKDTMRNIMTSHQTAAKYEEDATKPLKKKKKKGFTLPYWMMYIAWIMVFFSITGSGFFTILYSMEWGREKSLEWLSTFLLSFFQSVVVVQPVKVLLLAAFISCVLRKPELDDEESDFDDANGGAVNDSAIVNKSEKDLQALMMQRKMANEVMKPPDTASLEASRKLRLQEMQMEAVLKECIVYLFFLMVLFFISYQARDADSFMYAENIKNTFIRNSPSFDSINSPQNYWKYINKALIPNLYSGSWYNGKELDWRERLQIDDRNTMRVGVARLRQHRVKDDTCIVRKEFQTMIKHCRDAYSWTDDDTRDYLRSWELPSSNMIHRQGIDACYLDDMKEDNMTSLHDEKSPWVYRNSFELKNAPYPGTLAMYKGGGYTFTFKRTMDHTTRLLAELEEYEWVDPNTRALFIEFTLYNGNVNLFGSVIMLVEFMPTGSAITRAEVKVFRLSNYIGGWGAVVLIFELTFLGFVIYFFVNVCRLLKKEKMQFFQDFWNLLEFSMLVMAIVSIAMYGVKAAAGKVAIYTLHESQSGDYVNFVTISIWDELFGFILAIVVFCATIKFIKMLKFNKRMGMLGDTIKLATKDLRNFSLVFFVFFFAFSMMAYVLYGKMSPDYGTFVGSVQTLFRFALGDFDFYEMQDIQPVVGPVFFFLYVAIIYIALMGMFLTIIYDSFAAVKENTALQANDYEIVEFMVKRFKGVFGWS